MSLRTCVTPQGVFRCGIHKPHYSSRNLRTTSSIEPLGTFQNGAEYYNSANFPEGDVVVGEADWVYEIPNPFPFRGTTYIAKSWADAKSRNLDSIRLPQAPPVSMSDSIKSWQKNTDTSQIETIFQSLPKAVLLTLAGNSTDPDDLTTLAKMACEIIFDQDNQPTGLIYKEGPNSQARAQIHDYHLFKILANNPNLPDAYKEIFVLKPGAQGKSEIVGEWQKNESHVFEYLRSNSYIPWGHYAANMANDAIRYTIEDLRPDDMSGMRHLYYQRTYIRLAEELGVHIPKEKNGLSDMQLENLRLAVCAAMHDDPPKELVFDSTLWGWNFGYDCTGSKYKLHASHQMIHQQFSMLPTKVECLSSAKTADPSEHETFRSYGCGDLVADFIHSYHKQHNSLFFEDYIAAIKNNKRLDDDTNKSARLTVYEDKHVILFVPKAQTSQWELQLMTLAPIGNILEADTKTRKALNTGIYKALKSLTGLGAKMITTIEFPKRFKARDKSQRLLYSFLPKLPDSPGAFSEAQLRWINGHYPEDFAHACRMELKKVS